MPYIAVVIVYISFLYCVVFNFCGKDNKNVQTFCQYFRKSFLVPIFFRLYLQKALLWHTNCLSSRK